jgi:hypothetical protein
MSVTIWRGRFTDAPMRNTGNVPCRLSRNYLKDQREGPVIFVSPRTGAASRRPTTRGHIGRYANRARVQLTHRAPGAIPHEDFTVNKSPL